MSVVIDVSREWFRVFSINEVVLRFVVDERIGHQFAVSEKIAVGQDLVVKMVSCDINIRYAFFVCDIDAICLAVILADIGVELFQKTRASWWDFTASH